MHNARINFSKNWNGKLDKEEFTTIRTWSPKFKTQEIFLNKRFLFEAEILEIIDGCFKDIPKEVVESDTGMSHEKSKDMFERMYGREDFKTKTFYLIKLRRI